MGFEGIVIHRNLRTGDQRAPTIQEVYDTMTPKQKAHLHLAVGEALVGDSIYDSLNEDQKAVFDYLIEQAKKERK